MAQGCSLSSILFSVFIGPSLSEPHLVRSTAALSMYTLSYVRHSVNTLHLDFYIG